MVISILIGDISIRSTCSAVAAREILARIPHTCSYNCLIYSSQMVEGSSEGLMQIITALVQQS